MNHVPRFISTILLSGSLVSAVLGAQGRNYADELDQIRANASKLYNCNPDPCGEPWIAGGGLPPTIEQMERTPLLVLPPASRALPAEFKVTAKYLRPVFRQLGGSCAQAGGIGYHYTYAMNSKRNTDAADTNNNCYPHHYTWNFLNNGVGDGSSFIDGWDIGNDNGIPSIGDFGAQGNQSKWMTGYDKYLRGMKNRFVEYKRINVSTVDGINSLKQWIYNYGEQGATSGGLGTFSVNCIKPLKNNPMPVCPAGTAKAGWICIPAWGGTGGHVMTIAGWDDSVRYDVNKDNKYTNTIDITGDGIVDVRDWEIGGWLVLNSWGSTWPSGYPGAGYFYMLYRTGALPWSDAYQDTVNSGDLTIRNFNAGGLTTYQTVYTLRSVKNDPKNALTFKIMLNHSSRSNLAIIAGVANNTGATAPDFAKRFIPFNHQGGSFPMQGSGASADLELCLDVKQLLGQVDQKQAKYFLMVEAKNSGTGSVKSFSLLDYRGAAVKEQACTQTNVAIPNNDTTILSIVYESETAPLLITTTALPNGKPNTGYSFQLDATGGVAPHAWSLMKHVYTQDQNTNSFPGLTTAIQLSPSDTDDAVIEKSLGFEFPFYGEKFSKVYITTDGCILFSSAFATIRFKKTLEANKAIAVLGADLVYRQSQNGKIYFTADAGSATIRWNPKHMWDTTGYLKTCTLDFAAKLFPSGRIEFYYGTGLNGDPCPYTTCGISNGAGANFIFPYDKISQIPGGYKTTLTPDQLVGGLDVSANGLISGTPTSPLGDYRLTFAVEDQVGVTKTKSFILKLSDVTPVVGANIKTIISPLRVYTRRSSVMFSFGTLTAANVCLEAYSLGGKKVQTVYKGTLNGGTHKIVWNIENSALSKGTYLCRLSAGKEQVVRKVTVLK